MSWWNIGVDMEEHEKFHRYSIEKYASFYSKVFTPEEIAYCKKKKPHSKYFAGIFAGKEAIYKAVSPLGQTFLSQYEIAHLPSGMPVIRDRWNKMPDGLLLVNSARVEVKLSISHTQHLSIAYAHAVIDRRSENDTQ